MTPGGRDIAPRGRIVVLEGLDGVGKSTLAQDLAESLGAQYMTTPDSRMRTIRRQIHALLDGRQMAMQLLYAATVQHAGVDAAALARTGRTAVIDRYWLSTIAYALTRGSPLHLAEVARHIEPADITLLITLDEAERQRRLLARGCTPEDRESLRPSFAHSVLGYYRRMLRDPVAGRSMELDITGMRPDEALAAALRALGACSTPS